MRHATSSATRASLAALAFAFAVLLVAPGPARANQTELARAYETALARASEGDFEDGKAAFFYGFEELAYPILLPFAEDGDPRAQYMIGELYAYGMGDHYGPGVVEYDYEAAARWYEKAGEQGHARALYALGWMHARGQFFPKNENEALRWYDRAAALGSFDAREAAEKLRVRLGLAPDEIVERLRIHEEGNAAREAGDHEAAWELLLPLAEAGHRRAQAVIGDMFRDGHYVAQDYVEAARWYGMAAEQDLWGALRALVVIYEKGWGVERDYETAVYWATRVDESAGVGGVGEVDRLRDLELRFALSDDERRDFERADAAFRIGDYSTARKIWLPYARDGNAEAQLRIGGLYFNGFGVDMNSAEALRWFESSAAGGFRSAFLIVGSMYEAGVGVEQNIETAIYWFMLAVRDGDPMAMDYLADLKTTRLEN